MIPHSRPTLGGHDIEAVSQVIRSGQIAQAEQAAVFEKKVSAYMSVRGGVATASGTAALHLILLALRVDKGSEVIIPSYVCVALLNAVHYVGAKAILADIDPSTFNMDVEDVRRKLTKRTRAIILPHMFGLPADVDQILTLGVPVIEDCAQSVGAIYRGKPVGSFGRAAVFSFYATKVITTGEGGMLVSDDDGLLDRARDMRGYDQRQDGSLRYNYKMSDIQAALGLSQLGKLEQFIFRRRMIARRYSQAFSPLGVALPSEDSLRGHIYYRYVIDLGKKMDADLFMQRCLEQGVCCRRPIYKPLHLYLGMDGMRNTQAAWRQSVSIPIYPSLQDDEVDQVIETVAGVVQQARAAH